ncbi:MAG: DUF4450 domain-containing protein [Steroidobacteraceae bacterium]|nr:DUF4450 domain-containing protein [Steroidobacteraceae bacterium]
MAAPFTALAQSIGVGAPTPNLAGNIDRPLRYRPDGGDFVIVNGGESFNRALYGRNTAFRVEAGDRPEFVLYLPGRGGNLRLGIRQGSQAKWLHDAAGITTRYRPGELRYEIRDPLLGVRGMIELRLLALRETDGLLLQYRFVQREQAAPAVELLAAFGGVNGERGVRDGDIGTERIPIREWFQLRPEFTADNSFTISRNTFELRAKAARISGVLPAGSTLRTADARRWTDAAKLFAPAGAIDQPVLVATLPLDRKLRHLALQRVGDADDAVELSTYRDVTAGASATAPAATFAPPYPLAQLPAVFDRERAHARRLREQIAVRTPDPYVNAAVGALNVAADAVWDEPQQSVMHGAIAWRARLLGWRGAYAMDALGWHERARAHLRYWAGRQNLSPVPAAIPGAEEATHLARNPQALHSNGDLSNSHYDMNLVYVDALFRHLLWTGDRELARETWPVIERHLAWERRLFRREFGPEKLPLYEAYAAIWASDDLQYHGGGVTHASAYNFWHNTMAARVARWLGEDAAPYEREAALIRRAMSEYLWIEEQGMYAEYRDWSGLQRAHPAAALWSFYHVLDAPGLTSQARAYRMTRYIEQRLPKLPVRGAGIDREHHLYATSSWMPYTWSINNVVMGENMHAALGFWQANREDEAFTLFRSALLASMYMGISPGNVGTLNYLDVYRRESQRDFADGAGTMSRALVEGLFGVRPDAIDGVLLVQPGWPAHWSYASLRTPSVEVVFRGDGDRETYDIRSHAPALQRARLRLRMKSRDVRVNVGGVNVEPTISMDALGQRWLEAAWTLRGRQLAIVEWTALPPGFVFGDPLHRQVFPEPSRGFERSPGPKPTSLPPTPTPKLEIARDARFDPVPLESLFNDRVTEIFRPGKYLAPRSPFASLAMPSQGIGSWAGHVNASAEIDDSGLRRVAAANGGRFLLPNGVPLFTPGEARAPNIAFVSQWDNYPRRLEAPLTGRARGLILLMAGSTNHMQSRFDNGEVLVEYADGSRARLELHNPTNWWPIDQDYFIDDFQFRRPEDIPPRLDLKTGTLRIEQLADFKGRGGVIAGGAATVLELPLDPGKELRNLEIVALANEVVIGLMSATLVR